MDKALSAALPAMPIGLGVDRLLSNLHQFVILSAQPLVSLSPFIIPLLIAVAWKLCAWMGPVAAVLAVVPVLGALLNAEAVLQERALMPLPGVQLRAERKGQPVCRLRHAGCRCLCCGRSRATFCARVAALQGNVLCQLTAT
jgi:hypothetical protein